MVQLLEWMNFHTTVDGRKLMYHLKGWFLNPNQITECLPSTLVAVEICILCLRIAQDFGLVWDGFTKNSPINLGFTVYLVGLEHE